VLVRKASRIRPREAVGTWLYGVAYRTALGARSRLARRRAHETPMAHVPACVAQVDATWHDLRPILDHELNALPDKYRLPIVLCDLEGRTRKDVARALAIPEGTLSSRLATARKMLAARLTRRGVTLTAGALGALLVQSTASAGVPSMLLFSTTQAALVFAAGPAAAAGMVPGPVAALTEGVLRMMFVAKLKMTAAIVVGVTAVGLGTGGLLYQARASMDGPVDGPLTRQQAVPQDPAQKQGQVNRGQREADAQKQLAELRDRLAAARLAAEAARQAAVAERQRADAQRVQAEAQLHVAEARLKQALADEARVGRLTPTAESQQRIVARPTGSAPFTGATQQQLRATELDLRTKYEYERQRLQKEEAELTAKFAQQRMRLEQQLKQLEADQQVRLNELRLRLQTLAGQQPKQSEPAQGQSQHREDGEKASYAFACRYVPAAYAAGILEKLLGPRTGLFVAANDRTNTVIVAGPENRMKMVTNLMKQIDTPDRETPAPASGDKLDRVLKRLDQIEQRLNGLERGQAKQKPAS